MKAPRPVLRRKPASPLCSAIAATFGLAALTLSPGALALDVVPTTLRESGRVFEFVNPSNN